jgi:hypothetical protein
MEPVPAGAETWHDDRTPDELIRERIIGENTLRHLAYLQQGLRAADAVVRVEVHGIGSGTGFLIAPDLMLANNHVIADQAQAAAAEITFFYQFTLEGPVQEGMAVRPADQGLLYTDPELDISLVRLAHAPALDHYPPLRPVMLEKDSRVAIIQHPGGGVKKISLQNNLGQQHDRRGRTTTDPGTQPARRRDHPGLADGSSAAPAPTCDPLGPGRLGGAEVPQVTPRLPARARHLAQAPARRQRS